MPDHFITISVPGDVALPSQSYERGGETSQNTINSNQEAEIEIISLVQENLPKYKLRADYITKFAGYSNQDFLDVNDDGCIIQTPTLPVEPLIA